MKITTSRVIFNYTLQCQIYKQMKLLYI